MALSKCKECGNEISTKAEACPKCGAKIKSKSIGCGGALLVLIILGAVGSFLTPHNSSNAPSSPAAPSASDIKAQVMNQVKIQKFSWNKSGFGNVMMATFSIENKSKSDVKDIEITCEHAAKSGTNIDSNKKVIYDNVSSGKTKIIRDFNMGFIHSQASATSCRITDLVVK